MKNYHILFIVSAVLFFGCRKEEVETPHFDVEVEALEYKVGEEVKFNFSGEVDQLSFFSGEMLQSYEYSKESRMSTTETVKVSFRTNVTYNTQPDQLAVFVSNDYNGSGAYSDLVSATWLGENDFSPWFKVAPEDNPWGQSNNYYSGEIDLIDAFKKDKPLYIGFRYKHTKGTGIPRNWYVYNMNATASTLLGTSTLFNTVGVFSLVYDNNFVNEALKTSQITTYMLLRLPTDLRSVEEAEVWAVSPPIYLEEIDHGPDRSVPVKGFRDPMPSEFKHTYTDPGKYIVTFVGGNTTVNGEKEKIKQIELIIND
ncbi:DUF5017 domain-containing protein [Sphingobacterium paucimobilis]|uniref:DUF5017 domain-containing protein n=1 Tax=Sphingobacterium paucimobilis HER1398 TaxID=1346330 RepID=U2JAK2_9SPHI|nr:DUF5017 domain-containing protein [Sphingobacterium paucimobilis]ERJ59683.1 hypothetical protein M472_12960 [Sphingobacterium paucimobilis HER1398]